MKIAVLSDIHGNLPALRKVLEDARRRGADEYIVAGDLCISGPDPDACISMLRQLDHAHIIRGNEERYLESLTGQDPAGWTDGQMQVSYWCFRNITKDNLRYLLSLPHTAELVRNGVTIRVAHAADAFLGDYGTGRWTSNVLSERYRGKEMDPEILSREVFGESAKDPEFRRRVSALRDGVYIFGHSHVQWQLRPEGRNICLINPGSCGLPLDGEKDSIPYTMLTVSGNGRVETEQLRIPFDKKAYVAYLKSTEQYAQANVWSRVIIRELLAAREHVIFFLRFAERYAEAIGDTERPFSVQTWENAYKAWESSPECNADI